MEPWVSSRLWRGPDDAGHFGGRLLKMIDIPGVDDLGLRFERALQNECVINPASGYPAFRGALERSDIIGVIERDNRKAILNILNKEEGLLWWNSRLYRQASHHG